MNKPQIPAWSSSFFARARSISCTHGCAASRSHSRGACSGSSATRQCRGRSSPSPPARYAHSIVVLRNGLCDGDVCDEKFTEHDIPPCMTVFVDAPILSRNLPHNNPYIPLRISLCPTRLYFASTDTFQYCLVTKSKAIAQIARWSFLCAWYESKQAHLSKTEKMRSFSHDVPHPCVFVLPRQVTAVKSANSKRSGPYRTKIFLKIFFQYALNPSKKDER